MRRTYSPAWWQSEIENPRWMSGFGCHLVIGLVDYEVIVGVKSRLREVDTSQTQRARNVRACGQTGEDGQGEIMEAR